MMSSDQLLFDFALLAQTSSPWFKNPGMFGAILGSSIGVFGGVYGTLVGTLAPRGKAKSLVLAMHWSGIAVGVLLMALSITALLADQPYAVWYGLGLPGVILIVVLSPLLGVVKQRYREAEQRRLDAESFRQG